MGVFCLQKEKGELLVNISPIWLSLYIFLLSFIYFIFLAIWRLFLCPQANIPGPTLAKLTFWYEFYFDVIKSGQYVWKIRQLHNQYGPIIRINPEEVHIEDANFYDEVYTGATRKRDKWSFFTNQSGLTSSAFATNDHDLHRMRRAALNPYFSKQKVRQLQPRIEKNLNFLLERFDDFRISREPLMIGLAYAALANDIVMDYALSHSENRLLAPDFDPSFKEAGEAGAKLGHLVKQMPWLLKIMKILPNNVQMVLNPTMASFVKLNQDVISHVARIYSHRHDPYNQHNSQTSVFHEILQSDLPEKEKIPDRLWQDGQVTVIAGTLTTAAALSEITFHLLDQPMHLRKLKTELDTVSSDPGQLPEIVKLEQLPYLTAVIKEGLRLSSGISTRLQRIATEETLTFTTKHPDGIDGHAVEKTYTLPPGIPLSMTGLLIHHSPTYFEDPMTFWPQRWLEDRSLDKYFVPFSRGTRSCVGINLAYAELYLTIATVFGRYGSKDVHSPNDRGWLELYKTSRRDLDIVGDGVTPLYRVGTKGVVIKVHSTD